MPFRRLLASAERFSDRAMLRGLLRLNRPRANVNASLACVTRPDHLRLGVGCARRFAELDVAMSMRGRYGNGCEMRGALRRWKGAIRVAITSRWLFAPWALDMAS